MSRCEFCGSTDIAAVSLIGLCLMVCRDCHEECGGDPEDDWLDDEDQEEAGEAKP